MSRLIPGNYPGEYNIRDYKLNGPPSEFLNYLKIIIASDIRRFTETMEDLKDPKKMGAFLSEFFDESAKIIQNRGGLMNKYLGDGFLAHFSVDQPSNLPQIVNDVMQAIFEIHSIIFPQLKKIYGFTKLGLSIVLSIDYRLPMGRLGVVEYTEYSMIGRSVNSIFRALDAAKGNLVLVFDDLSEFLDGDWIIIDLGTQTYDGLSLPIRLYSVVRKKMKDENDKIVRGCTSKCELYFLCKKAWKRGVDREKIINCQYCEVGNSYPCWHWYGCKVKDNYGRTRNGHKDFECCHICINFRRCYHSYFLGRINHPMIWCESHFPCELVQIPS